MCQKRQTECVKKYVDIQHMHNPFTMFCCCVVALQYSHTHSFETTSQTLAVLTFNVINKAEAMYNQRCLNDSIKLIFSLWADET